MRHKIASVAPRRRVPLLKSPRIRQRTHAAADGFIGLVGSKCVLDYSLKQAMHGSDLVAHLESNAIATCMVLLCVCVCVWCVCASASERTNACLTCEWCARIQVCGRVEQECKGCSCTVMVEKLLRMPHTSSAESSARSTCSTEYTHIHTHTHTHTRTHTHTHSIHASVCCRVVNEEMKLNDKVDSMRESGVTYGCVCWQEQFRLCVCVCVCVCKCTSDSF